MLKALNKWWYIVKIKRLTPNLRSGIDRTCLFCELLFFLLRGPYFSWQLICFDGISSDFRFGPHRFWTFGPHLGLWVRLLLWLDPFHPATFRSSSGDSGQLYSDLYFCLCIQLTQVSYLQAECQIPKHSYFSWHIYFSRARFNCLCSWGHSQEWWSISCILQVIFYTWWLP